MEEAPAPIVLVGVRRKGIQIPPALLQHTGSRACHFCSRQILLGKFAIENTERLAALCGREVQFCCEHCAKNLRPDIVADAGMSPEAKVEVDRLNKARLNA